MILDFSSLLQARSTILDLLKSQRYPEIDRSLSKFEGEFQRLFARTATHAKYMTVRTHFKHWCYSTSRDPITGSRGAADFQALSRGCIAGTVQIDEFRQRNAPPTLCLFLSSFEFVQLADLVPQCGPRDPVDAGRSPGAQLARANRSHCATQFRLCVRPTKRRFRVIWWEHKNTHYLLLEVDVVLAEKANRKLTWFFT